MTASWVSPFAVLLLFSSGPAVKAALLRPPAHSADVPVKPLSAVNERTPIHLLISAFQDGDRCAATLQRALDKARRPERVSFNVMQAKAPEDVSCIDDFKTRYVPALCAGKAVGCEKEVLSRVHFWAISLEEAKGPVHQRGLLSERADLSGAGSMCLSTDSHMSFIANWDEALLEDWASAENEFAVMSAYPLATQDESMAGKSSHINLCGYFLSDGVPRGVTGAAVYNEAAKPSRPTLTMNWAAGQSFSRCHAERNVPVDKNLMWMFNGEEIDRAVRLWTHGYDLYNPGVNAVLHNYSSPSQHFWEHTKDTSLMSEERDRSDSRLRTLLAGRATAAQFGNFGLGDQRTLEEYVTWSHTDLGSWDGYLRRRHITPNYAGQTSHGAWQPGSDAAFCESLKRLPVRDVGGLVKKAAGQ